MVAFFPARAAAQQESASSPGTPSLQPDCRKSIDDALKAARTALAADDAAHDHEALVCLLAAVSAVNAERLYALRGNGQVHVLAVPKNSGAPP